MEGDGVASKFRPSGTVGRVETSWTRPREVLGIVGAPRRKRGGRGSVSRPWGRGDPRGVWAS